MELMDLWDRVYAICSCLSVRDRWIWVPSHQGHQGIDVRVLVLGIDGFGCLVIKLMDLWDRVYAICSCLDLRL